VDKSVCGTDRAGRIDGLGLGETWRLPGVGSWPAYPRAGKNPRGKNLGMDVRLNKADAFTSALSDKAPIVIWVSWPVALRAAHAGRL
jgi:hypothetical protein